MSEEQKGGEDMGQPFSDKEKEQLQEGPAKNRGCTDVICIPLFLAHIVAFYVLTFMNAGQADVYKLISGMDYQGNFCGIGSASQWKGNGPNMESYTKMMWSMNVDELFGQQAKAIVCGDIGYTFLVPNSYSSEDFGYYCGSTAGTLSDVADAMSTQVNSYVTAFSDPAKAVNLFSGAQSSIGTGIMSQITKNFNQICASACSLTQLANTSSEGISWQYTPSYAEVWGNDRNYPAFQIWNTFAGLSGVSSFLYAFQFTAWPESACPYSDKRYCIPTPGVSFSEPGDFNVCMPELDSGVASTLTSSYAESLNGLASLSVTEDASKELGDVIGDILKTWPVFIIVAVLSFVLGLLVLVLMRFVLAPLVWGSIFVIFVLMVGGGFLLFVRAGQCKGQSFESAAESASGQFQGGNLDIPECGEYGGYSIEHDDARTWTKIAAYVVMGFGGLFFLGILCMCCRIRLAIAINQVACQFMYHNPGCLFVPIVQNLISFVWILFWVFCAAFILSVVPDDYVPSTNYATYDIAYGTADTAGKCTDSWPSGGVYITDDSSCTAVTSTSGTSYNCYTCSAPRFTFGWEFLYAFFTFEWHAFFIVAVGQCTIAGAVGCWFFARDKTKVFRSTITTGLCNVIRYHVGSLAFGSLILAIIATIKWVMAYLAKQAKAQKNKVAEIVFKILGYCIYCFEKCVKFLNKNAYIQIALMGTNFCKSAKAAFWLILRNALRFMVICMLSFAVHFLAMCLIIAATAVTGYFILQALYEDINPLAPTVIYGFIGYFTAKLFIGVFALSVDTCLQCFIACEEMGLKDLAPGPLQNFINEHSEEKEGYCDHCCCSVQ
jgi:hypothetical protein